jgi:D-alanyl-D-alanine carboxypeptidase (penicillin-binding protein 5/6)
LDSIERKIVYDSERVYKGEHNGAIIDMIDAPVSKGQVVGTLFLSYNGEELGSVSLIAQSSVDASGLLSTASRVRSFLFGKTMRVILIIFGAVVAFYVLFSIATAILRGIKRIKKARRAKEIAQRKDQDE